MLGIENQIRRFTFGKVAGYQTLILEQMLQDFSSVSANFTTL